MSASSLLVGFRSELARLESAFVNIVDLHARSQLGTDELEYSVEALVIRAVVSFESFLREMYMVAIDGESGLQRVKSYVAPRDRDHARAIVYAGAEWLAWLPVTVTMERAHRLLKYGQPFSRLELRRLDTIEKARVVRNRIAHDGEAATRLYEKRIVQGDRSFERPAKWLLHAGSSGSSNLSLIVARLQTTGDALATDKPDLDALLGPPEPRQSNSMVPAGRYRCDQCRQAQSVAQRSKLSDTSLCDEGCTWRLELLYGI